MEKSLPSTSARLSPTLPRRWKTVITNDWSIAYGTRYFFTSAQLKFKVLKDGKLLGKASTCYTQTTIIVVKAKKFPIDKYMQQLTRSYHINIQQYRQYNRQSRYVPYHQKSVF